VGYLILVVVNLLLPKLQLMNPVVSLVLLVGVLALNELLKFKQHFGLDEQSSFKQRYRWFYLYGAVLSGLVLGLGIVSSLKQVLTWAAGPLMTVGLAGLFLWAILRTKS